MKSSDKQKLEIVLLSIVLLLIAFKNLLPVPRDAIWLIYFVLGFIGVLMHDKAQYQHTRRPSAYKSNPLVLDLIIILAAIYLTLFVIARVPLKTWNDLLVNQAGNRIEVLTKIGQGIIKGHDQIHPTGGFIIGLSIMLLWAVYRRLNWRKKS